MCFKQPQLIGRRENENVFYSDVVSFDWTPICNCHIRRRLTQLSEADW